jgi:hypothetical protein
MPVLNFSYAVLKDAEAYQKLIPLRDEACEMDIQLYEE